MAHARVLLVGGTGFIGSQVAGRLAAGNRHVLVPTRRYERARHLLPLPTVEVVEADVHDDAQLRRLVGGVDAVINLVGILHGRRGAPWGPEFDKAHVRLPARIAAACTDSGVRRLLHMSALGVQAGSERSAPSMYLRSKAAGEQAGPEGRPLEWTIFRASPPTAIRGWMCRVRTANTRCGLRPSRRAPPPARCSSWWGSRVEHTGGGPSAHPQCRAGPWCARA